MDHAQYTTLMDVLNQVPDYRKRKGRLHRWMTVLRLIAMGLASAQRTPQAIARWIGEHRTDLFAVLPPTVSRLPSGAIIRRALARLDVAALESALTAFHPPPTPVVATPVVARTPAPPPAPLQGVALDGKAVRGVGRDGHSCHLVSLVQHGDAIVLGQVEVARKRDERSALPALLNGRDLRGKVVTLDALHTLRPTARPIRTQQGHYLMIVKKNQAALYAYLDLRFTLPAHPADHEVWQTVGPTTEKGHGRLETRTLTCGNAHIEDVDWPDVQHVVRRECERIIMKTGKRTHEVTYGLVSMPPAEAGAALIEALWRGHWTIENRVHYVRDVSFGEDARHAAQGTTAPYSRLCGMGCSCCFVTPTGPPFPMRSPIMGPPSRVQLRSSAYKLKHERTLVSRFMSTQIPFPKTASFVHLPSVALDMRKIITQNDVARPE